MNTLVHKRSMGRLYLAGVGILSVALSGCGTPSETSSSNSSSTPSSIASSTSSSSSDGSSWVDPSTYDHCVDGFRPHFTNGHIGDGGHRHERNGEVDISVDPTVYNFMYDNGWQDAHVLWHQARTCGGFGGGGGINGLPSACNFTHLLPNQNDCQGDENGLEFLAAHSLMMYQLRELWPDHPEQFAGWGEFPRTAEHYPPELRSYFRGWSSTILESADIGDNIEQHMDKFPTEGALGTWISCAIMPGANNNTGGGFGGFGGFGNGADFSTDRNLHFAFHNNGVPTRNQKHAVNNNNQNIDSFLFWKLHGWIDMVWHRYREAKGMTREDSGFQNIMEGQCREMDAWREIAVDARGDAGHPNQDEQVYVEIPERGFFHEQVRPGFERAGCANCHGEGEEAHLRLGYEISSTEVVQGLINRQSSYATGYKMVVPGDPESSWLYLKASGKSASSGVVCQGNPGCASPMTGLTDQEIENLRRWIADGAQLPEILP